jgi:Cu(I)/Ag(I) efflux system membrane protein CusA/SilA
MPLALTKTLAMAAASLLAVTLVPALMVVFVRGRIRPEAANPVSRVLLRAYRPVIRVALRHRVAVLAGAGVVLMLTLLPVQERLLGHAVVPFPQIGAEFMPPLDEGDLLYMPTTLPGVSPQRAKELLQQTDRIIASFPEVERVFGKAGRADTATDPAPLSMIETTIVLKPKGEWRPGVTTDSLVRAMDRAIQIPGLTNSWTMPIKTRNDMLATGIRTPVGVKLAGDDLAALQPVADELERALRQVEGTRSVVADRVMGGTFLDVDIDRAAAARYGLTTGDVQDALRLAVGGQRVTTILDGRARYGVTVRYPRALRHDLPAVRDVRIATPSGAQVPLGQVATLRVTSGPPMIKSENARPNAWVYVDLEDGTDVGSYVQAARAVVARKVDLPDGVALAWSGQYEYLSRANRRLGVLVPLTLGIIFLLLYAHFRRLDETLILLTTLPFAAVGAVWLMAVLGYNWSIAVGVGLIAVAGLAAETGVVMQVYLDEALARYRREGRLTSRAALHAALEEGAVDRVRPKLMTVCTTLLGLMPIMLGTGTGSTIMRRIATPMVGGLVSSTLLTLVVIPAAYAVVKGWDAADDAGSASSDPQPSETPAYADG